MLIPFDDLFRRHRIQATECLHIGANTGQEAEAYTKHGIRTVVWIEAERHTFEKLVMNVGNLVGHVCLRACVSDVDGKEVEFHVANNNGQSSSILEFGTHAVEHPTVQFVQNIRMRTSRVDTLLRAAGITFQDGAFLNIDLQGAELLAMKGMGALLPKFSHIYVEVNREELYKGCPLVGDIDQYLAHLGYEGKDEHWTGSGWGDKYYQKVK